ncbi:MAG: hypothetical protein GX297_03865, partial [Treponema sp.]|nr:hypothetical protein [Treponema sp.]
DYGFRDYSPNNARFTTIDPIRDGNNWFAYVVNDPVNYIDPFGLTSTDSGSGKPTNTNPANNNAPNEPSTGSNVQKIKEIMHDNSYNKNAFNPNDLQSKNYTEQLNYIQKVFEEKKQAYNNSMNQKFVKIIRDSVGATYSHTRMPTATEMDCSGILVYTLDKMGFSVPSDLTAADIANGRLPGIILYDEADNSRQGDAGVLNFYYFDENYISHVNYGVGIQGNETKNQVVDASSKNTTWQNGKDGNSGRNANENQNPKAEPGKINKTWAPFTTEEMPDYQAYIDFTKLERKN